MSLMSWSAAVQTERAVGEWSLSGRGARVVGPLRRGRRGVCGEGAARPVAGRRGGVMDGDRVRSAAGGAGRAVSGVVVSDRAGADDRACLRARPEDVLGVRGVA